MHHDFTVVIAGSFKIYIIFLNLIVQFEKNIIIIIYKTTSIICTAFLFSSHPSKGRSYMDRYIFEGNSLTKDILYTAEDRENTFAQGKNT